MRKEGVFVSLERVAVDGARGYLRELAAEVLLDAAGEGGRRRRSCVVS
jgi:hypothetical protein